MQYALDIKQCKLYIYDSDIDLILEYSKMNPSKQLRFTGISTIPVNCITFFNLNEFIILIFENPKIMEILDCPYKIYGARCQDDLFKIIYKINYKSNVHILNPYFDMNNEYVDNMEEMNWPQDLHLLLYDIYVSTC